MLVNYRQRGATLIVALVILAIVTIIGVTAIRGTNLELKMIAGARDRAIAFEAVEIALLNVEERLRGEFQHDPRLDEVLNIFTPNCAGGILGNGMCFDGYYEPDNPYITCRVYDQSSPKASEFWEDPAIWADNSGRHGIEDVKIADPQQIKLLSHSVKYIVEFACFNLKKNSLRATVDDTQPGDKQITSIPLFRITAFADGPGERAKVVAQAIVKINPDPPLPSS